MTRVAGRRGFTLAEMIMAIGLLALFSVFIVQIFVKSDQLTQKARNLDQAVACASDLADLWKMETETGIPVEILDLRQNRAAGKTAALSLDQDFRICLPGQAVFEAVLTIDPLQDSESGLSGSEGSLWKLALVIDRAGSPDSGPIYMLQTLRYFPAEVTEP